MPRPGPRPYECVRRSWHSPERHQSMRGSIIQQIFRVVTEAHSAQTKKNREYREKLPIVVLRAEEIMYSKANSEAEYTNLDTLWERLNDATDTIIRRDESTETGDLLPPCVEAALNLGCVPVRASRSERHNNPRSYLPPRTQEPAKRPSDEPPAQPLDRSKVARPDPTSHNFLVPKPRDTVEEKHKLAAVPAYPVLYESNPYRFKEPTSSSIYPWVSRAFDSSGLSPGSGSGSGLILVGTPVGTSTAEAAKVGFLQNNFCNSLGSPRNLSANTCDLSLRLGLSSEPCLGTEGSSSREDDKNKSTNLSLQGSNRSRYFPTEGYYHQSQFK